MQHGSHVSAMCMTCLEGAKVKVASTQGTTSILSLVPSSLFRHQPVYGVPLSPVPGAAWAMPADAMLLCRPRPPPSQPLSLSMITPHRAPAPVIASSPSLPAAQPPNLSTVSPLVQPPTSAPHQPNPGLPSPCITAPAPCGPPAPSYCLGWRPPAQEPSSQWTQSPGDKGGGERQHG